MKAQNSKLKTQNLPDEMGHFGIYGGRFAPETLMPALQELTKTYLSAKRIRNSKRNWIITLKNMSADRRLYFCREAYKEAWRRKDIFKKGRPLPHWRA